MKPVLQFIILSMVAIACCGCSSTPPTLQPATETPAPAVTATPPSTIAHSGGTGAPVAVRMRENSFDPNFITVKAGTTVEWTNEDTIPHTVTFTGEGQTRFDSGSIAKGQSFSNTFLVPGRYPYACTQHSFMTGTVVVE